MAHVTSMLILQFSNLETLEKKALEEKLQRANSAKLASVSFQNFHIPQPEQTDGRSGQLVGSLISGLPLTALNSDLPGQILGQVSQKHF
jgi:type IV secretory pathway VirB10-like protein